MASRRRPAGSPGPAPAAASPGSGATKAATTTFSASPTAARTPSVAPSALPRSTKITRASGTRARTSRPRTRPAKPRTSRERTTTTRRFRVSIVEWYGSPAVRPGARSRGRTPASSRTRVTASSAICWAVAIALGEAHEGGHPAHVHQPRPVQPQGGLPPQDLHDRLVDPGDGHLAAAHRLDHRRPGRAEVGGDDQLVVPGLEGVHRRPADVVGVLLREGGHVEGVGHHQPVEAQATLQEVGDDDRGGRGHLVRRGLEGGHRHVGHHHRVDAGGDGPAEGGSSTASSRSWSPETWATP